MESGSSEAAGQGDWGDEGAVEKRGHRPRSREREACREDEKG